MPNNSFSVGFFWRWCNPSESFFFSDIKRTQRFIFGCAEVKKISPKIVILPNANFERSCLGVLNSWYLKAKNFILKDKVLSVAARSLCSGSSFSSRSSSSRRSISTGCVAHCSERKHKYGNAWHTQSEFSSGSGAAGKVVHCSGSEAHASTLFPHWPHAWPCWHSAFHLTFCHTLLGFPPPDCTAPSSPLASFSPPLHCTPRLLSSLTRLQRPLPQKPAVKSCTLK